MNCKFNVGGYELEITDHGHMVASDGMCAYANGQVGLQITHLPLGSNGAESAKTIMQAFVKPSQARAIASAILSAATEARGLA